MQFNIILIYKKNLLFQPLAASSWADGPLFFSLSPGFPLFLPLAASFGADGPLFFSLSPSFF